MKNKIKNSIYLAKTLSKEIATLIFWNIQNIVELFLKRNKLERNSYWKEQHQRKQLSWHNWSYLGRGNHKWGTAFPHHQIGLWACPQGVVLIRDWCRRVQSTVGSGQGLYKKTGLASQEAVFPWGLSFSSCISFSWWRMLSLFSCNSCFLVMSSTEP